MPATLLIGGKQPEFPSPKVDRLTPMLESFNRLSYDGNHLLAMRNELAMIDRRCASRLKKLDDPALRDHLGFEEAREEWLAWNAEAVQLNAEVRVLTADLQQEAITVDELFQAMPVTEQQGVLEMVSWWFPQMAEFVKGWLDIRSMKGWKQLLRSWGFRYEAVPF